MFFRIWLAKRHHYHHSPRTVGYNRQTHPIPEAEYSTSSLHPVETCCPQDRQAVPRHIVWKVSDGQQTLDNPGRKHQYPYSANQSREGNRMPTHYQDCYATNDEVKAECWQKNVKYPLQATTTASVPAIGRLRPSVFREYAVLPNHGNTLSFAGDEDISWLPPHHRSPG